MKGIFEDNTDAKRAYREMHILRHLRHPSIVSLLNVIIPSKSDSGLHGVRNTAIISTAVIFNCLSVSQVGGRSGRSFRQDLYLVFEFVDTDLSKVCQSCNIRQRTLFCYILLFVC